MCLSFVSAINSQARKYHQAGPLLVMSSRPSVLLRCLLLVPSNPFSFHSSSSIPRSGTRWLASGFFCSYASQPVPSLSSMLKPLARLLQPNRAGSASQCHGQQQSNPSLTISCCDRTTNTQHAAPSSMAVSSKLSDNI